MISQARNEIESFFQYLASKQMNVHHDTNLTKEKQNDDDSSDTDTPQALGAVYYLMEFCLDKAGVPLPNGDSQRLTNCSIPLYNQVFQRYLPIEEQLQEAQECRSIQTCFNCGGDHTVADCPKPKDVHKISTAKHQFLGARSLSARYHRAFRYDQFKPGVLSPALQEALDIDKSRPVLPDFISRMRLYGYPPGHRLAAQEQVTLQLLSMHDAQGHVVVPYEDVDPDKERSLPCPIFPIKYPGFNAPNLEGFVDRPDYPPIRENHIQEAQMPISLPPAPSRKHQLSPLRGVSARKRRKETVHDSSVDMDVVSDANSEPEEGEILANVELEEYDPTNPSLEVRSGVSNNPASPSHETPTQAATLAGNTITDQSPGATAEESVADQSPEENTVGNSSVDHNQSQQEEKSEEYCPENNWSLDFPPGRVDLCAGIKGGQWKAIHKLLKARKK
ncbi:zinc finger CCHC domain-containing protein 8-like isoform X2 [Corticium candelabrum]|uniref:zinc finger CCHC domain-containing protein 8-like isoform X2 n=1 Tax=Corticium candelabrum TaxID=121492 RepID=UPI002E2544E1|nr:zinc finger CCHC domain-containing protein 8-like isoform X2 [Corticium candelabrum]